MASMLSHPQLTHSLRVVHVEDNDDVRETIGLLLSGPGREVVSLSTGEQALAQLADQPCDVLITDLNLPGVSGQEVAHRVLERNPRQWVVLCSGNPLGQEVESWGRNVRVLPKLFKMEELDALLDEITQDVMTARQH